MFQNNSDGILIVSNNSTISMPIPGTTHSYNIDFESSILSSGIYFYSIKGKNFSATKKMILLR